MKKTIFLIFSIFSLVLLAITRSHSAYANDGLMIDEMLDAIAIHNVEIPEEIAYKATNTIKNPIEYENVESDHNTEEELEGEINNKKEMPIFTEVNELLIQEKDQITWWDESNEWKEKISSWWEWLKPWWLAPWIGWSTSWMEWDKPPTPWWSTPWWGNIWWNDETMDYLCNFEELDESNQEYTIIFNTNWWENIQPTKVHKWNSIEELPVPIKTWYKFWWWYWGEFYVINSINTYKGWCNNSKLIDADKYCILSLPAWDDINMEIYVSPFNLEITWSACKGEQYCRNLNIWWLSWWLPVSYFSQLKTEWLLDSYTFSENYNMFRDRITNFTSLIYNLTAQWSEKSNHYRGQYINTSRSNNCNMSGACGKEDSTKNLSIRCISISNTELSFGYIDEAMWAVRYNWWPIIQDTTLYAKWDWCDEWYIEDSWECVEWINVIFDAETNWGKTTADPITVLNWTTIDLSEFRAVKSWYNFIWWNTNPNAKEKLDDNYVVEKWETLYAIFSKVMYWIFNRTLTVLYSQWEWIESINKTFDTCEIFNNETSCNVETPDIILKQWYENWHWISDQWNVANNWRIITLSDNVVYTAIATKISNWQSGWWWKKWWEIAWSSVQKIDNNQSKNQDIPNDSKNTTDKENNNYSNELYNAYEFAYKNWITTKSTIKEAKMDWKLTRIEMAKMLTQYAINVLWKIPDLSVWTQNFVDVSKSMDSQYNNAVTLSYQLWIMWQNMKNNKFRPNDKVTRWEFATALSRMLYWLDDGIYKSTWKFYIPHISKLYNEWIIQETNPSSQERRWYIMLMLMRSVK